MPLRQVTERDLEQLRQQYCVRDGMERRHQSQINGLREKQAKSMEELVERHEREMEALTDRQAEEIENLAVDFANEEEALLLMFEERKERLGKRWELMVEVLRVGLEKRDGKRFAKVGLPRWPEVLGEETPGDACDVVDIPAITDEEVVDIDVGAVPIDVGVAK